MYVQTSLNEIVFSASTKITSRLHVTTCTQQIFTYTIKQKLISPICLILKFSSIIYLIDKYLPKKKDDDLDNKMKY